MSGLIADLLVDGRHDTLYQLVRDPLDGLAASRTPLDRLRLADEELTQLATRVQKRIGELADVFRCELPPGQNYRDVLAAAHARLAMLSADAACMVARQLPIAEKRGADVAGVSTALARYVNRFVDPPLHEKADAERTTATATDARDFDHKLIERLTTVVALCREARCPLSLILFEVDHFASVVASWGPVETRNVLRHLRSMAGGVDHPGAVCLPLAEAKFAVVIADCDRRAALAIAQHLQRESKTLAGTALALPAAPTLSLGVATVSLPSKNFPPRDLLQAASRCLDASKTCGGRTIKSIDVF
jgi:GGDEF domain-containing protein